jgi:TonB family protein
VLATLDRYIEDCSAEGEALLSRRKARRRFALLFMLSGLGHLIVYTGIIKLDQWMLRKVARRFSADNVELVRVIDLAPPFKEASGMRGAPEHLSRADISHLSLDRADDTALISRSPRPAAHKSEGSLPDARLIEQHLMRTRGSEPQPQPPLPQPVQIDAGAQKTALQAVQASLLPHATAPAPPPLATAPPPASPREGNAKPVELGLREVQGQYLAYVRAKIYKINDQIMPREWIKDILTKEVSADFEVVLARGGRLLSARLMRSCGYPELDNTAAQAIRTASPFEGYPPGAGDTLILNVRVYYRPIYR